MRYRADIDYDTISAYALEECASAKVRPSTWTKSPALALRHARAMAAVLRAAKAERSARLRACRNGAGLLERVERWRKAQDKTRLAVDRLVAVEKEVKRGK